MVDKRIKVHNKEIYDFVREKKNGRTWTEIKKKFIDKISEKQIALKLRKMVNEDRSLMHIKKQYMANYFYNPKSDSYASKVEDDYIFIGYNRIILEKIPHIIHKALLNYLEFLVEKNHSRIELKNENPEAFKNVIDSMTWTEKIDFYNEINEINDLKYFLKEGFKFFEHKIKTQ